MVSVKVYVGTTPLDVYLQKEYCIKDLDNLSKEIAALGTRMAEEYCATMEGDFVLCLAIVVDDYEYPCWIYLKGRPPKDSFMSAIGKMNPGNDVEPVVTAEQVEGLVVFHYALSHTNEISTESVLFDAVRGGTIWYPDLPDFFKDYKMTTAFLLEIENYGDYDIKRLHHDIHNVDYEYLINFAIDNGLWKCMIELLRGHQVKFNNDQLHHIVKRNADMSTVIHDNIPDKVLPRAVLDAFGFYDIQHSREDQCE